METSREAFDLHNKACRANFLKRIRTRWNSYRFWKMVFIDTKSRVCSTTE